MKKLIIIFLSFFFATYAFGVTRYIDVTKETSTLTGAWSCAAGTNTWSEDGTVGNAVAELNVNDWISISATQKAWYKVSAVTDDDNFTTTELVNADVEAVSGATVATNTENGQATSTPYGGIRQALDKEAQAAGDIWYIRGGQEEYMADLGGITIWEADGTSGNYIQILTDTDGAIFSDATPGQTLWMFKKSRTTMINFSKDFCRWKGIKTGVYGAGDNRQGWNFGGSSNAELIDCWFSGIGGAQGNNYNVVEFANTNNEFANFIDCDFDSSGGGCVRFGGSDRAISSIQKFTRCTFYGGGNGFNEDSGMGGAFLVDCKFGIDGAGANDALTTGIISNRVLLFLRNPEFNCTTDVSYTNDGYRGITYIEDYDLTRFDNRQFFNHGLITRDTGTVRGGGGDSSAKMVPNTNCTADKMLVFQDFPFEVPIEIESGGARTITVYVYANSWGTLPVAAELYMEVDYYAGATSARTTATSTEALASADTWTALTVTVTPNVTSLAYIRIYLNGYEDGTESIFVDPVPVVS